MNNRLLIGFTLVALITTFNVYQNRDSYSGNAVYTGFGFSFPYTENLNIYEVGSPDFGPEPSEFAGSVVAMTPSIDENFKEILVEWRTTQESPSLDEAMEYYLNDLATASHVNFTDTIGPRYIQKGEHIMAYWIMNGNQMGLEFMVVHGIWLEPWESLRSNRLYIVGIITPQVGYTPDMLDEMFRDFIDSFKSPV
ncbi:hypothetical protein E2P71_08660 [Candidatus Bathyarchaeota archaeon]|nr:hypothetical protein E2P71_08660 [Candidatus Bathyarchaeota archaeon]